MAKLVLTDITSLESQSSAIQSLNLNYDSIESAFDNTLSRDGTGPNQMEANLDMNSYRLLNLPAPTGANDPARLVDLQTALVPQGVLFPALQANKILSSDGTVLTWIDFTALPGVGNMLTTNNLSDLTNIVTARSNLGLGSAAVQSVGTSGANVGLLNANLTFSGTNTFTQAATLTAGGSLGTNPEVSERAIGFRGAPPSVQDATYTLVAQDAGKTVLHTSASAHTWTIPPEASVAYPAGTVIVLANPGSGSVTLARGAGVSLRIAGSATDKNMTITQHGVASLIRTSANTWYISGAGVT